LETNTDFASASFISRVVARNVNATPPSTNSAALKPGGKLVVVDYVKTKDTDDHAVVGEAVIDELKRAGYELTQEFKLLLPRQYFFEFKPVPR
jgi:predicted methyltransferase